MEGNAAPGVGLAHPNRGSPIFDDRLLSRSREMCGVDRGQDGGVAVDSDFNIGEFLLH